ncbi:hypothetical protein KIM372_00480 [Bombiscardovia nodaiensis]|uniref:RCC1-like domain-containing protein n=1 Tax=Bombiscardovia nodaiensis TaxID=2932181 RepID=A0ABM8B650_9BIFI|nr:hypothetical protein KIM372_00480 [Bombiscardovia nodaiensis]
MRAVRGLSTAIALAAVACLGLQGFFAPVQAQADPAPDQFAISPDAGDTAGGTQVTITPYTIPGVKLLSISSGNSHTLAIGDDGKTYAWGDNSHGQLGDNSTTAHLVPESIAPPAGVKFTQVSAGGGGQHSLALGNDYNLYAWGMNNKGQLGLGDTTDRLIPTKVTAPTGVRFTSIAAGWDFSLARGNDGKVYAWGNNDNSMNADGGGQLGVGDTAARSTPTAVVGLPASARFGVKSISTQGFTSLALGNDGNIYAWGNNAYGQLATGDQTSRASAVAIPAPTGTQFNRIIAGRYTSMAMANNGKTYMWGDSRWGQFGDGSGNSPTAPPLLAPTEATIKMPEGVRIASISRGSAHTVVVGNDGKAYSWGSNSTGQLGNTNVGVGSWIATPAPVSLPSGVTCTIAAAGGNKSFVVGNDGNVYAWGENTGGALGDGSTAARSRPVRVGGVVTISQVRFDGSYASGPSVDPISNAWTGSTPPHAAAAVEVQVDWTANGVSQPMARLKFSYLRAYTVTFKANKPGVPDVRQSVPTGRYAHYPSPTPAWDGRAFNGWFLDGHLYDFGTPVTHDITLTGQWGDFSLTPVAGPVAGGTNVTITPPPPIRFTQISNGGDHTLALGSDGKTYAWGWNTYGQLGNGTTVNPGDPHGWENSEWGSTEMDQVFAPVQFIRVCAGYQYSLAIGVDGKTYAWGLNRHGQLGYVSNNGTMGANTLPLPVQTDQHFTSLSAGGYHTLALTADGTAYSWGDNVFGELGRTGTNTSQPAPVNTSAKFTQISAGLSEEDDSTQCGHSLALATDGTIYSWGHNGYGELGRTTANYQVNADPQPINSTLRFISVSAGENHSLAVDQSGRGYAWGYNEAGKLGSSAPTAVGSSGVQIAPIDMPNGVTFTQVSAGWDHSLALGSDHLVYVWGSNRQRQLGNGFGSPNSDDYNPHPTPARVATDTLPEGEQYTDIRAAGYYSLALSSQGDIYQWGDLEQPGWGYGYDGGLMPGPQIEVTSVDFGGAAGLQLHYDDGDHKWHVVTPAHADGTVDVTIGWTVGGHAQQPAKLRFTYYLFLGLPAAGSIPLQRLSGGTLLALSVITAVFLTGYQLSRARKRRVGQHSLRPNHSNRN